MRVAEKYQFVYWGRIFQKKLYEGLAKKSSINLWNGSIFCMGVMKLVCTGKNHGKFQGKLGIVPKCIFFVKMCLGFSNGLYSPWIFSIDILFI